MFFLETSIILKTAVLLRKICSNPQQTPLTLTSEPRGRHERKIFLNQVHKQHLVSVTITKSKKKNNIYVFHPIIIPLSSQPASNMEGSTSLFTLHDIVNRSNMSIPTSTNKEKKKKKWKIWTHRIC